MISVGSKEIQVNLRDTIIPKFLPVFKKIMTHEKSIFVFKGGRGSTKSSFIGICIVLLIINNPLAHAVCFRQVGNTIQRSIYAQITWAIYLLGVEEYFHIPKNYSNPIIYKPTGQQIIFMGLDDPDKVKSIKLPFGYIAITWLNNLRPLKTA